MTLRELKTQFKGRYFCLIQNVSGKGLGLRKFRHYRQHDNALIFELPDGSISEASLTGVDFASTSQGFTISANYTNPTRTVTLASYELTESLFYPCIENKQTGHIDKRLSTTPMTYDDCREFLERNYSQAWRKCEAIPQPVTHPYFEKLQTGRLL